MNFYYSSFLDFTVFLFFVIYIRGQLVFQFFSMCLPSLDKVDYYYYYYYYYYYVRLILVKRREFPVVEH